jgi:hypothetical protein
VALADFFQSQLAENRESYLRKRILHYRIDGKRRWFVAARQTRAYVWQHGRFDNDVEYWQQGLSEQATVKPVKRGRCLRFFLDTRDDFQFFQKAATSGLLKAGWSWSTDPDDSEDAEGDSEE